MTQLSALPVLSVYVAFNPTSGGNTLYTAQNIPVTNPYWTEVTPYVRSFNTKLGRQHFLDRVEASTLNITLNNRTGYFSSGTHVLDTRMPIKVIANYSSTPYGVFYGIIDNVVERLSDVLNIDLDVQASDLTKYMSLRYLNSPTFWSNYCLPPSLGGTATSAIHWYDCNKTKQANITAANATSSVVTYTYAPGNSFVFIVGDKVTITGLTKQIGAAYNQTNVTVTGVGTGYFTTANSVSGTPAGNSLGQGIATKTFMTDLIGTATGEVINYTNFTNNGAIIYEINTGIDLGNGSNYNAQASLKIPYNGSNITNVGGIDFWMNGVATALSTNIMYLGSTSTPKYFGLYVNPSGNIEMAGGGFAHSGDYTKVTGPVVNDGYWHHIGIVSNESGYVDMYCDGVFYSLPTPILGPLQTYNSGTQFTIGYQVAAYFDEIIINSASSLSTLAGEVQRRYQAGSLLQLGFPTTSNYVYSGDRIAEILCLAGFGYITGGNSTTKSNIALTCNYYINDSSTAWVPSLSTNGYTFVEPWYYDSPITGSTALDLILQVCSTDIGMFFQTPEGNFYFYNQNYYGSWAWNDYTQKGSWTSSYTAPDSNHTWADTGASGTVPYFGNSLQVTRDDVDVWTTVKVTPQSGVDQIFENTAAEPRWGYTTLAKGSTLHTSLTSALSTATYLGFLFQAAKPRVQFIELRAETANGTYIPAMLGAELGDPVNFQRNPSGASSGGSINSNFIIESISHDFQADPGQWHTTFILDPYPLQPTTTYFP